MELIGAGVEAIHTAEDRRRFKAAMIEIGLSVPRSGIAYSLEEALAVGEEIGYPLICRPSFILGGGGTGFAADPTELEVVAANGLAASPVGEILLEQSIAGWKEYELEVMRDGADNAVVVCSIENLDPMGTHTGDSITVAPAQTLTDVEYQTMRDAAFACIRRIGVETGGSNIQFAVNPADGEMVVIEMNPRVSRSSALASKATGFPIAKIAAKLAVGYRLDEVMNDITGETPAQFEPTIDYVVVKIPRFAFEKFTGVPAGPRHQDAVGRRGHGHRPHLHRVGPEGLPVAGDRPARAQRRPRRSGLRRPRRRRARPPGGGGHPRPALPPRSGAAAGHHRRAPLTRPAASTPGSSTRSLAIDRGTGLARRGRRRRRR